MTRGAKHGDSFFKEDRRPLVPAGAVWQWWPLDVRAEALNECRTVDLLTGDYLALADFIEVHSQGSFNSLPWEVRAELDAEFGMPRSGLKKSLSQARAEKARCAVEEIEGALAYKRQTAAQRKVNLNRLRERTGITGGPGVVTTPEKETRWQERA